MDDWENVLGQIERSRQQIVESIEATEKLKTRTADQQTNKLTYPNGLLHVGAVHSPSQTDPPSSDCTSSLENAIRMLRLSCSKDRTIPFVVEGGSDNGE